MKEGGSKRGGGDYTIIQITAGYNLVADVSRSTMPTTHRRACVCAYTPTEFQNPASGHRGGKKNKKKTPHTQRPWTNQHSTPALCHSVWESFSSLKQMRQSIKIMTKTLFSPEQ